MGTTKPPMKLAGTFLLILCLGTTLRAQEAYDRDLRVDPSEVPIDAVSFVTSIGFTQKVKWFEEHAADGITYEAKSKLHQTKYSIEFFADGELKDVEFDLDPSQLTSEVTRSLDTLFERFRIIQLQVQVEDEPAVLWEMIRNETPSVPKNAHYEIVINGIRNGLRNLYEVLLDVQGMLIAIEPVRMKNTAHLDF
jgi:hypothetical protein